MHRGTPIPLREELRRAYVRARLNIRLTHRKDQR